MIEVSAVSTVKTTDPVGVPAFDNTCASISPSWTVSVVVVAAAAKLTLLLLEAKPLSLVNVAVMTSPADGGVARSPASRFATPYDTGTPPGVRSVCVVPS